MNEKNQLKKRIKFYLVGSNSLAGSFLVIVLGLFVLGSSVALLYFLVPLIYFLVALSLLAFTFALVLFANALIIFSKVGRIYPSLQKKAIFGGAAGAAYPALCIAFIFALYGPLHLSQETFLAMLVTLNPITFGIALAAIHAVIMRKINKVVKADLAQVLQ